MQQKHSDMHAKIYEEETEESEDNPDYLNPQPMNWKSPVSMPRLVAPNNEAIFNASNMQIQNPNVMRGATNDNEPTLQNLQQNIQFTPDMQQQLMSRMFDMM